MEIRLLCQFIICVVGYVMALHDIEEVVTFTHSTALQIDENSKIVKL